MRGSKEFALVDDSVAVAKSLGGTNLPSFLPSEQAPELRQFFSRIHPTQTSSLST